MLEKVSRKQLVKMLNGKRVTLISTSRVTKEEVTTAIKALEHKNIYHTVATMPIKEKYTGVLYERSNGFYRVMKNGDKSYKDFDRGSYIMSDGKITFIYTPDTMRVCIYRTEN